MPRSSITARTDNIVSDKGSTDISVIKGEQLKSQFTLNFLTNLAGSTVKARVIEATNDGSGSTPTTVKSGATAQDLVVLGSDDTAITNGLFPSDYSGNQFNLVIPENIADGWSPQPTPGDTGRVYGFWELEVSDSGTGNSQQIWVPVRGLLIVRYSIGG